MSAPRVLMTIRFLRSSRAMLFRALRYKIFESSELYFRRTNVDAEMKLFVIYVFDV